MAANAAGGGVGGVGARYRGRCLGSAGQRLSDGWCWSWSSMRLPDVNGERGVGPIDGNGDSVGQVDGNTDRWRGGGWRRRRRRRMGRQLGRGCCCWHCARTTMTVMMVASCWAAAVARWHKRPSWHPV